MSSRTTWATWSSGWITINEPSILGYKAYLEGSWPPNRIADLRGYARLQRHAARGHRLARQALKARHPSAQASMAFAIWPVQAIAPWSPVDQLMAAVGDWAGQGRSLSRSLPALDWIGVNYYSRMRIGWQWPPWRLPNEPAPPSQEDTRHSDFGWEIYPAGLYAVLRRVGRYAKPVMITENGIADAQDRRRPTYIVSHLRQAQRAIADGVNLRGYMHWTLLDNFEWAAGYTKCFGLATRDRELRPSARLYGDIARANALV